MRKSFLLTLMLTVYSVASAQFVNVELKDGTVSSYSRESTSKVTFGENVTVELKSGTVRSFSKESTSKVTFSEKAETDNINGHAYVELAGIKWATENVGRLENEKSIVFVDPTYGCYYAQADNEAKLAAESWGSTWTLPTKSQWQALISDCYWQWTDNYSGQKGYIVYKAQNDNDKGKCKVEYEPLAVYSLAVPHIFLPAAGYFSITPSKNRVEYKTERGYYWSSDVEGTVCNDLYFNNNGVLNISTYTSAHGMSVRPVSE